MKKIKVLFDGFSSSGKIMHGSESEVILKILEKHYTVEVSENPDYIFYNVNGQHYYKYDGVRIFCTIEAICPDFNLCDYGIGFEYLTYGDRYFRFPNFCYDAELISRMGQKHERVTPNMEKREFCSFVYSNAAADDMRIKLFEALSGYKRVDSGGKLLNNQPDGLLIGDKQTFEGQHKFSVACENAAHLGYHTEKLAEAFAAGTVPIYWGDPEVEKVFNPRAFINCGAYPTLEAVVEKVRYLDTHPEEYLAMLQEPALLDECNSVYTGRGLELLESYLIHIIDQPYEEAFRRNRGFWGRQYLQRKRSTEHILERHNKLRASAPGRLMRKIKGRL